MSPVLLLLWMCLVPVVHSEIAPRLGTHVHAPSQFEVEFHAPGPLGLQLNAQLRVIAFPRPKSGVMGPAESSGLIQVNDQLVAVNEDSVSGLSIADVLLVLAQAELNPPRVLRFETFDSEPRTKSVLERRRLGEEPHEMLEVIHQNSIRSFDVVSAENFGVPPDCQERAIVVANPVHACTRLHNDLQGEAVLVQRGKCSFADKASNVAASGGTAVVVANSDDTVFQMKNDRPNPTNIGIPAVMIGKTNADSVQRLLASAKFHQVHTRLSVGGQCVKPVVTEESLILEREKEVKAVKRVTSLAGFLCVVHDPDATANHIAMKSMNATNCIDAFEFLSADFSGPLPVDPFGQVSTVKWKSICRALENSKNAASIAASLARVQHTFVVLKKPTTGTTTCTLHQVAEYLQNMNAKGVLVAGKGNMLQHLHATTTVADLDVLETGSDEVHFGPTSVRIPVIMVTAKAEGVLGSLAGRFTSPIVLHGQDLLRFRWDEIRALNVGTNWPKEAKGRKKLLQRMKKAMAQENTLLVDTIEQAFGAFPENAMTWVNPTSTHQSHCRLHAIQEITI